MLLEGDQLVVACAYGNEHADGRKVRLGEGIAGHVADTREALLVQGKANPGDFPGLVPHQLPVASAISAPLIHRDELLGVLNVNSAGDRLFTEFDLRAVSLFAEQAAAAIANARLYEVERAQVEELTHLNRMKSEFVALVSHELRTPIASIIGAVSSARKPELQDHRGELEDIVERAALRLGTMVEDLLAAAELERGEAANRLEPVDLAKVIREAATDHSVLGRDVQIDASEPALEERFQLIDSELGAYGAGLAERPQLVVLNKVDLLEQVPDLTVADTRIKGVVATSCATGSGIEELKRALFELCGIPPVEAAADETVPEFLEYVPRPRRGPRFRILRTDRGYRVVGTPPAADELEEALRRLGIRPGTQVEVGDEELEWQ